MGDESMGKYVWKSDGVVKLAAAVLRVDRVISGGMSEERRE